jgi:hypothetical protein
MPELDLRNIYMISGPYKDYTGYKQSEDGIIGKTVEGTAHIRVNMTAGWLTPDPRGQQVTLIFFTDGTYMKCLTWCE